MEKKEFEQKKLVSWKDVVVFFAGSVATLLGSLIVKALANKKQPLLVAAQPTGSKKVA